MDTDTKHNEIHFQGMPVSEGIAIGILCFFSNHQEEAFPEFPIKNSEVESEILRYRGALSSSREDLQNLQRYLAREGSSEAISIIDTHIQMLEDPIMTTFMEDKIRQMMKNTETVFRSVIGEFEKQFSKIQDQFFKQRWIDVKDLSKRILRHLHPKEKQSINDIPENSIVFSSEFVPSDIAEASNLKINAFISQHGGGNSHASLIARSKGIPFIVNIDLKILQKLNHSLAIVDGKAGKIIINPNLNTIKEYEKKRDDYHHRFIEILSDSEGPTQTTDGVNVDLFANVENLNDLEFVRKYHAAGIGLLRSEFLFSHQQFFRSPEEMQFRVYKNIIEEAAGLSIIFRLFDVGGDKQPVQTTVIESNPALGCRAIRFLLRNRDLFKIQVRALLRAAIFGNVKILLPLISDLEELKETKGVIKSSAQDLLKEGYKIPENVQIGCMIEVPSAVIMCRDIAEESDFLSIGTNDLVQYTLAADRNNPLVHHNYRPSHPSIVHMIKKIIDCGKKTHIPVSLCGEIASNPLYVSLLLGLGIDALSCAPRYIPVVRQIIKKISLEESKRLAKKVLKLKTAQEIYRVLSSHYETCLK